MAIEYEYGVLERNKEGAWDLIGRPHPHLPQANRHYMVLSEKFPEDTFSLARRVVGGWDHSPWEDDLSESSETA